MSVSRSPIHNEIRRREEIADGRKTATVIAVFLALAAFSFVGGVTLMVWK